MVRLGEFDDLRVDLFEVSEDGAIGEGGEDGG